MKAPWSGKLSAAKAGWLIALLFFGWLAFLFAPAPKPKPEPLPAFVVKPPSRLVALGLPDNHDLECLPEFFALYADTAEWKNDKTKFAYWNPGSNSYSYFFEAMRESGIVRFHSISKTEACQFKDFVDFNNEDGHFFSTEKKSNPAEVAALNFTAESPTHPIVFFRSIEQAPIVTPIQRRYQDSTSDPPMEPKQKVPEPIKPPPPELKFPQLDLEQRK